MKHEILKCQKKKKITHTHTHKKTPFISKAKKENFVYVAPSAVLAPSTQDRSGKGFATQEGDARVRGHVQAPKTSVQIDLDARNSCPFRWHEAEDPTAQHCDATAESGKSSVLV